MEILWRLAMAVLMPLALVTLAVIAVPVILFGRWEQRREIARALSRVLSAEWDGQGDCTFSAWSFRMQVLGKEWGVPRVRVVDWLNREPGHCMRAWEWHQQHRLFDQDGVG